MILRTPSFKPLLPRRQHDGRPNRQPSLLGELAHRRISRRFSKLNVPTRQIAVLVLAIDTHQHAPGLINQHTSRDDLDRLSIRLRHGRSVDVGQPHGTLRTPYSEFLMTNPVQPGSKAKRLGRGLSSLMAIPASVRVSQSANDNSFSSIEPKPNLTPISTIRSTTGSTTGPNTDDNAPSDAVPEATDTGIRSILISSIVPNKYQPRRNIDDKTLEQLAESIRRSGLMQPIIVRPKSSNTSTSTSTNTGTGSPNSGGGASSTAALYELVAGERRWRAAKLAGLTHVPALVRDLTDEDSAEWAIVENIQREDLNPIERAWAFRSLVETFGLTHGQIAERIGIERPTVANFIRLTELEETIQGMISAHRLTLGHGKVLLGCPPGETRTKLAERAINESWNIKRLEREVGELAGTPIEPAPAIASSKPIRSAALDDLEKRLGLYLGTKVQLNTDRSGSRGRLTVEFYGLDHFDGMMSKIGFSHG